MSRKLLIINILLFALFFNPADSFAKKVIVSSPLSELQFVDRADIEEVVIEEDSGVTEIPDYAFLGCVNLKKISFPSTLRKIGFQAFSECGALETLCFPDSLDDIGSNSFAYCSSLKDVVFPANLKHIGHNAFSFCTSLEVVWLPDSLMELESYAFSDCGALRFVRLPANGSLLGELIFNCCGALVEIVAPSLEVPEFDCESFIFDPIDSSAYLRCLLKVPDCVMDKYNVSNSWNLFHKIVTID